MTEAWLAAACAGAGAAAAVLIAGRAAPSEARRWLQRQRAAPVAQAPAGRGGRALLAAVLSRPARRRRALEAELIPLLELLSLELEAGCSPAAGLAAVSARLEGPLASDFRRLLLMSQVAGSSPFEARLEDYAARRRLPAVASLACILHASRDFGAGVLPGVRALAADLRRAQRRELIAQSRRALNQVLAPAAFGILLPFLGILLYPALSTLTRSLR